MKKYIILLFVLILSACTSDTEDNIIDETAQITADYVETLETSKEGAVKAVELIQQKQLQKEKEMQEIETGVLEIKEQKPVESPMKEEKKTIEQTVTSNKNTVVETCNSLCGSDRKLYCGKSRKLVFENAKITYGTCRVFGKYVEGFSRCEKFCKVYGHEKGCELEDGTSDAQCKGK